VDIMKKLCILLMMVHDLLGIVHIRVLKNGILGGLNILQVTVLVIKSDHLAEEDKALVLVVRAGALHLVGEKHFVKVNDPTF
jgi:hypothetical protein